jgi:peptide/nickel transport system permease protein
VLHAVLTLFFVLAFNFYLFRVMPGDPYTLLARSERLSRDQINQQIDALGLNDPMVVQFVNYLRDTLTGELGISVQNGFPVTTLIGERIWPTTLLVGLSTLLSTVFGLLIGIRGAWRRGSTFDTSSLYGSLVLYSMPEGWMGMLFLLLFAGIWGIFPAGGRQSAQQLTGLAHFADIANHLFLPCLTLTLGYIGEYAIIMRSSLLEVKNEEFVQTARAKGVRDRDVRWHHAVPNAILPTLTLVFYSFGFVLGGAIIVERVFSYEGLGSLTYTAIGQLDYPVLEGVFLLSSAAVILFNLFADIMYGYLDPRIREA